MAGGPQDAGIINPVYIKSSTMPSGDKALSVTELCRNIENTCGKNSVEGAQLFGGLWRVYLTKPEYRLNILLHGFDIRGVHVEPTDTNPYTIKGSDGQEVPTTKLTISDVSLLAKEEDIVNVLKKAGINPIGGLRFEYSRDESGELTRWKTGRRFTWIPVPAVPLKRDLRIGIYSAKLFHKEQWYNAKKGDKVCNRCLEPGHYVRACANPIKCRTCLKSGHRAGDPICDLGMDTVNGTTQLVDERQQAGGDQQAPSRDVEERDSGHVTTGPGEAADAASPRGVSPVPNEGGVPSTPLNNPGGSGGSIRGGGAGEGGLKRPPPISPSVDNQQLTKRVTTNDEHKADDSCSSDGEGNT